MSQVPRTTTLPAPPTKRPRLENSLAMPAASASTASPATPAAASTSKPYGVTPSPGGLALPQWGTTQTQQPMAIDPALQNLPPTPVGHPPATGAYSYAPPPTGIPQQPRPGVHLPLYQTAQQQQNGHYAYPAAPSPYSYYPTPSPYAATGTTTYGAARPPASSYTYTPPASQTRVATPSATPAATPVTTTPATTAPAAPPATNSHLDSSDPNDLNDALGAAGLDLNAEAAAMQRGHEIYHSQQSTEAREDRSRQQSYINASLLGPAMRTIAAKHNVTKVSDDAVNYAALALRERLLSLITSSIEARNHRSISTYSTRPPPMYSDGTPMWSLLVRKDLNRQLTALEKVHREEEFRIRQERHERAENGTSGGGLDDDEDGSGKKRKKMVTARNMTEEQRHRMTNAMASAAAGSVTGMKSYSWMTSATPGGTAAKSGGTAAAAAGAAKPATSTYTPPATGGGWARAARPGAAQGAASTRTPEEEEARKVTLRDVEFAIEREKGHGGGRGSARGWT